jgi:NADP-dependent 3-hydroxy acid dehydrogenase YdfG
MGIGASLVCLLHHARAHVFFGDVLDEPARALAKELHSPEAFVKYVECDVMSYADNLALFDAAYNTFGRVDHAISNAGLGEQGNLINPELDLASVREEPKDGVRVIDVNLKGPVYFARLASVYLRQSDGKEAGAVPVDKSLTFTSSVAAFREDPGLYVYVASKHGVMGLMRVLRRYVLLMLTSTVPFPSDKARQHTHQVQTIRHQNKHRMSLDDANSSNARRRRTVECRRAARKHARRRSQDHHGRNIRFESERGSGVRRRRPRLENRAGQNRPATAMAR